MMSNRILTVFQCISFAGMVAAIIWGQFLTPFDPNTMTQEQYAEMFPGLTGQAVATIGFLGALVFSSLGKAVKDD